MKPSFLPVVAAAFLASLTNSEATDFQFTCEWIVDGEVASSVSVENYDVQSDNTIQFVLPQTDNESAMEADFDFFDLTSYEGSANIEITVFEGAPRDRPKETRPAALFDGTVNFEWGKPTTIFTSISEDTKKALVFTLTPPENWDAFAIGKKLTEEEIEKLDYSTHISNGEARLSIHNGNTFEISKALVRIKSTADTSEEKVDRVYSVDLRMSEYSDRYTSINDRMRLPEQEYEITLEAAFR